MATESKIFWDLAEKRKVAELGGKLVEEKGMTWVSALFEAQNVLPVNRRRTKVSIQTSGVKPLRAMYEDMVRVKKNNELVAAEAARNESPDPLEELDMIINTLANHVCELIKPVITAKLHAILSQTAEQVPDLAQKIAKDPRKAHKEFRKQSIVIVGMRTDQMQETIDDYAQYFNITHVPTGSKSTKLRAVAMSSEKILLMTGYVSHTLQEAVRRHGGLEFVNGSVSSLRVKLDEILTKRLHK